MKKHAPIFFTLLAAALCLVAMYSYLSGGTFLSGGTLRSNIDFHFLPSKMFGVPEDLAKRGIEPLYLGEKETGWDGQFYYYMSNDLLGLKDTPSHIDAPSYRYQRIGLSLYAAGFSRLLGQSWVSPLVFYISYLTLVLIATWGVARIVRDRGGFSFAGLLWAAGVGTQVTLLNALPDAAADAFLILATLAILTSRQWIGVFLLTMAALSRESYVIFPAAYLAWILWEQVAVFPLRSWPVAVLRLLKTPALFSLLLPLGIFVSWQLYIRLHFGVPPFEQAHGILALPFQEWWIAVQTGISGNHYLVPPGIHSYLEGISLIFFMLLLLLTLGLAVTILRKKDGVHGWIRALALGSVLLVLLYACFGRTVTAHYTGYLKAANLFLFLIPLFLAEVGFSVRRQLFVYGVLVGMVAFTSSYLWRDRILFKATYGNYTRASEVSRTEEVACLKRFDVGIRLVGMEDMPHFPLFNWRSAPLREVFWVDLTNYSGEPFVALHGKGSVNMSYHWMAKDGLSVAKDGIRSMMPEGLPDGQTARVPVIVEFPDKPGDYILRLTPVQENCAWFYTANPASALDLQYRVR